VTQLGEQVLALFDGVPSFQFKVSMLL